MMPSSAGPGFPGISADRGKTQMMSNRREMLCHAAGALTGLPSIGCGLASPAFAQAPQRRREVVVNGKRVRTVDLHAHCHVPEANALMGLKVQLQSLVISPERIKVMDEQGIAAEQLEHAVKGLGLRGALIGGSVHGEELSDPKFHPFWARAEELDVVIFIHPQGTGELGTSGRLKGNGVLENVIGNPLETTIALSHLIFEGTLDSYPGLKICAAHAGGYLPSYAARSDQGCVTFPNRCTKTLAKKPTEYLRQLYYDSMVFTPEGLRHLIAEVGASQIVMGTDYPFPWTKTAVDHILTTPGLTNVERVAILGETAEKLLAIKPT